MKNRTTNKILSYILVMAFVMLFALSPGLVSAQITSPIVLFLATGNESGEGWNWNHSAKTLTLNGLDLLTSGSSGIMLPDNATIVLEGTNTITSGEWPIYSDGNLTITGTGVIDLTVAGTWEGIQVDDGNLTISGGTVNIDSGGNGIVADGNIEITGGSVNIIARFNNGINSGGNVTISGGTVNIDSDNNGISSPNDVTISSGTVYINAVGSGINADGNIEISGGTVDASAGVAGIYADGDIEISGGTVTVDASSGAAGIYTISGDIEITGGSVTAIGNMSALVGSLTALPTIYTWWASTAASDPGGVGTVSSATGYTYSSSHKYVRIVSGTIDYGLIFDTVSGDFYYDINGNLSLDGGDTAYTGQSSAWSWDSGTSTLNLNGFTYNTTNVFNALTIVGGSLTINLSGTNTFSVDQAPGNGNSSGIYVDTGINLTITGNGTLNAQGGSSTVATNLYSYGIYLEDGDMTINSGTVNATSGDVDINGSSEGIGLYDGTLTINGGVVNAKGGAAVGTNGWSGGAYADDGLVVNGGTLNATGGTSGAYSCGVYVGNGDITVNTGGTVNATGGTTGTYSFGVYGDWNININGGTLSGTGGTADSSCGVEVLGNITISGGTLNGTGGTATAGDSYGVYVQGGNVTISGGTLSGIGSTATAGDSYGVNLLYGTVTITGSTLIASGQTAAINAAPNISALSQYTYWTSTSTSDPGGFGTLSSTTGYTYSSSHKYLRIVSGTVDYGLIFDTVSGKFYYDIDGSATLDAGDIDYTDQSGAWSWNSGTSTLSLNGFTYSVNNVYNVLTIVGGNLTINLSGVNTFEVYLIPGIGVTSGIYTGSNLTITGSGTLVATGGASNTLTNVVSAGILSSGGLVTINSGTVNAKGGNIPIINDGGSAGIMVLGNDLIINGGTVNAVSFDSGNDSIGVSVVNGNLNINGGTLSARANSADRYSRGISLTNGNISISGGSVTALGGASVADESYGIYVSSGSIIAITGSATTLEARGQTAALSDAPDISALSQYTYWTNTTTANPGGNGTTVPGGTAYVHTVAHKYVMITTVAGRTTSGAAKTGDNSNMYVWSALALISVLGICVAVRKRRSAVK